MYKLKTECRACGGRQLLPVFDLGLQPLANDFARVQDSKAGYAPLAVMFCEDCTLAQLSVVVDPNILYRNYPYVTSRSAAMRAHFERLYSVLREQCPIMPATIVEIGSNDGALLDYALSRGFQRAVGIDPAQNLTPQSRPGLVPVCGFFNNETATSARAITPEGYDVVVARHVFAHVDDWRGFLGNVARLAHSETLVVLECPYAKDLVEQGQLDTIYHEHLSYITLNAVTRLLGQTGFHLHDVIALPIHGGALAMLLRSNDSVVPPAPGAGEALARECVTAEDWRLFALRARHKITMLREQVSYLRTKTGKVVCGFGASAKSTVWVNACGFTAGDLPFICDNTPQKQGCVSPGTDIPIVPETELLARNPGHAVLFAWNFKDDIIKNHQAYLRRGGKFIIPL